MMMVVFAHDFQSRSHLSICICAEPTTCRRGHPSTCTKRKASIPHVAREHQSKASDASARARKPAGAPFSPRTRAANSSDPHPPTSSTTNSTSNPQAFFFSLTVSMSRQSRAKAQSHHMLLYAARLITLPPAGHSSCTCNRVAQEAASSWPSCVG